MRGGAAGIRQRRHGFAGTSEIELRGNLDDAHVLRVVGLPKVVPENRCVPGRPGTHRFSGTTLGSPTTRRTCASSKLPRSSISEVPAKPWRRCRIPAAPPRMLLADALAVQQSATDSGWRRGNGL